MCDFDFCDLANSGVKAIPFQYKLQWSSSYLLTTVCAKMLEHFNIKRTKPIKLHNYVVWFSPVKLGYSKYRKKYTEYMYDSHL